MCCLFSFCKTICNQLNSCMVLITIQWTIDYPVEDLLLTQAIVLRVNTEQQISLFQFSFFASHCIDMLGKKPT